MNFKGIQKNLLLMAGLLPVLALSAAAGPELWDMDRLSRTPETWPANDQVSEWLKEVDPNGGLEHTFSGEGVSPVFYEGLPWQGKATRVFAWYGFPDTAEGEKAPAMVLVHGGGGTAFDEWVRQWTARGYAAIAMDLTGTRPGGKPGQRPRHEWAGPPHEGDITQAGLPPEDQWVYHAVADVILAHSLLRSFEAVDPDRIGMTGISWGGFLSGIVPAVDHRFAFSVPIYGCGYLRDTPIIGKSWQGQDPDNINRWESLWDPSRYVEKITCPALWINGANDPHFPLDLHSRTAAGCSGKTALSYQPGLHHSHVHGWRIQETYAFADALLRGKEPLVWISGQELDGNRVRVRVEKPERVKKAVLIHSPDTVPWEETRWREMPVPAATDQSGSIEARLPENTRRGFVNLIDARGFIISTPPFEISSE